MIVRDPSRKIASRETPSAPTDHSRPRRSFKWIIVLLLLVATGSGIAIYYQTAIGQDASNFVLHTVTRGDLKIEVTERGTLESQENVEILCNVDDIRGDGINGTPIVWLIENGKSVTEGELLIEFASASVQQELDEQILETEQSRSQEISARAKYENQIKQNETAEANAELAVKLAELEVQMFSDEANGTHKLEVEEINRLIDDINNEILAAQANQELKRNELDGVLALFKLGYAGKSEVDRTKLEYLQAESQYAAKINKLETQLSTLVKKKTYERQMQELQLEGDLATANRQLAQVKLDNKALLEQALAEKQAAEESFKKEQERLARWEQQVLNCKVHAPQDGMVVYAAKSGRRYWEEDIRVGAAVNPRQHVLSLPNLSKMQVRLAVHESVLNQVTKGTKATIGVEAFPERQYTGRVESVAVLSASQGNATKAYDTVVTIDGAVEDLRPGMTAIAEIHVQHLRNVINVPVQAIVQVNKKSWCYVYESGQTERREIELGVTNDKFVEVKSGLVEDEQVVLNPMSILENEDQEELEAESQTDDEESAEAEGANDPEASPAEPASDDVPAEETGSEEAAAEDSASAEETSPQSVTSPSDLPAGRGRGTPRQSNGS